MGSYSAPCCIIIDHNRSNFTQVLWGDTIQCVYQLISLLEKLEKFSRHYNSSTYLHEFQMRALSQKSHKFYLFIFFTSEHDVTETPF